MPPEATQATRTLDDFVEFLRQLDDAGLEFAVIGGCAVGAYARLRGESVLSADLDIYVRETTLPELLDWAKAHGAEVIARPQPRSIPVAVLTWHGEEINVLTASSGLPPPDAVLRTAREFELGSHGLVVRIADPFDVLANKLTVRRKKDLPHIELLLAFVYDEVVAAFTEERAAREALEPARRLLAVLGRDSLPPELGQRLTASASDAVRRRFLAHRLAHRSDAQRIVAAAATPLERAELQRIVDTRTFEPEPPDGGQHQGR